MIHLSFMEYIYEGNMILENLNIITHKNLVLDIEINNGIIENIFHMNDNYISDGNELSLKFENAIAFPGLINSHDHLEFNIFPKLGNRIYKDYVEWGKDIHKENKYFINKIQEIPYELRYIYGLYKNLVCGVTTIVHHGNGAVLHFKDLPDVYSNYNYIHSTRLEKRWKLKLNNIFKNKPFVIHSGEGTNFESNDEVQELLKWNIFRKKLIGVHAISVKDDQSRKFNAIVWCPDSNLFLYNKTADILSIKNHTTILFGTDSNVSADWNIWNHLRLARKLNQLDDEELYDSVSENAARVWKMSTKGKIELNKEADLVIANKKGEDFWDSFYACNPEDILMIFKSGKLVFLDEKLADKYHIIQRNNFDKVTVNNSNKLVIKGISDLVNQIRAYVPDYEFPIETEN
jgi:cytosine/adenosine deaminase-related metal-dependent hydrolase